MSHPTSFKPKRLLVHLDTTSQRRPALNRALRLAASTRVSLRLVDVLVPLPTHSPAADRLGRLAMAEARDRLKLATAEARAQGVRVTSDVLTGDVTGALVEESIRWRADVLMRSHGVHTSARMPPGPTDGQLLRRCPCPVWLVTSMRDDAEKVVVAAVDPDPEDPARHRLSVRVAQAAVAVAADTGATLHIVHAWSAYGHQLVATHGGDDDADEYVEACRAGAKARMAALVKDARVPESARLALPEGVSEAVVVAYVKKRRASLVVMGTVARSGLAGLIVGNTAEQVLRQVECSVLALKPDGFAEEMIEGRS